MIFAVVILNVFLVRPFLFLELPHYITLASQALLVYPASPLRPCSVAVKNYEWNREISVKSAIAIAFCLVTSSNVRIYVNWWSTACVTLDSNVCSLLQTAVKRLTSRASAVPNKYFIPYPSTSINPLLVRTLLVPRFRVSISSNSNFRKLCKSVSSPLTIVSKRLTSIGCQKNFGFFCIF